MHINLSVPSKIKNGKLSIGQKLSDIESIQCVWVEYHVCLWHDESDT